MTLVSIFVLLHYLSLLSLKMWLSVLIAVSFALLSQAKELVDPTKDERWLNGHVWRPFVGSQFQIVLSEYLDANRNNGPITPEFVEIFDIDLFDNSHETFDRLKQSGKKIICYFSAGTSETWRPDYDRIKEEDKGAALPSWPGENWLNTSSPNVLKLMRARIRYASQKGCDAIDPDNMGMEQGRLQKALLTSSRRLRKRKRWRICSSSNTAPYDQICKTTGSVRTSVWNVYRVEECNGGDTIHNTGY